MKTTLALLFCLLFFGCQKKDETTWERLPAPLSARIMCFAEAANGTYYGGASGLYKSLDKGISWEQLTFEKGPESILVTDKGTILVGTYRGGIFRSTDEGKTWTSVGFEYNVYNLMALPRILRQVFLFQQMMEKHGSKHQLQIVILKVFSAPNLDWYFAQGLVISTGLLMEGMPGLQMYRDYQILYRFLMCWN
jgi:hypothetical protein